MRTTWNVYGPSRVPLKVQFWLVVLWHVVEVPLDVFCAVHELPIVAKPVTPASEANWRAHEEHCDFVALNVLVVVTVTV